MEPTAAAGFSFSVLKLSMRDSSRAAIIDLVYLEGPGAETSLTALFVMCVILRIYSGWTYKKKWLFCFLFLCCFLLLQMCFNSCQQSQIPQTKCRVQNNVSVAVSLIFLHSLRLRCLFSSVPPARRRRSHWKLTSMKQSHGLGLFR
jgi:hypothetical protein